MYLFYVLLAVVFQLAFAAAALCLPLELIKMPPGFQIEVFAGNVPGARSLCLSPSGTLFIGSRDQGNVYAIANYRKDQKAGPVQIIARGLNMPNGVAFRDGSLYVAEIDRVIAFDGIESRLVNPPAPVVINDSFPHDRAHGWKYLRFGPDGLLYVPVGMPCNVCQRGYPYGTIMRMQADGSNLEVFASGVRNSVGFDWDPATKVLWFTDNGRDWLGDDLPPDELNAALRPGMNFGFPYIHGGYLVDPEYGAGHKPSEFTAPVVNLGPHVAALGMRFYTGNMFPPEYKGRIFIAEHGSWNRSKKIGYRISNIVFDKNGPPKEEVFAQGWLQGQKCWGRPVDVLCTPEGALLVSDDFAGVIYRITYKPGKL